jgi:hypothetical protein
VKYLLSKSGSIKGMNSLAILPLRSQPMNRLRLSGNMNIKWAMIWGPCPIARILSGGFFQPDRPAGRVLKLQGAVRRGAEGGPREEDENDDKDEFYAAHGHPPFQDRGAGAFPSPPFVRR